MLRPSCAGSIWWCPLFVKDDKSRECDDNVGIRDNWNIGKEKLVVDSGDNGPTYDGIVSTAILSKRIGRICSYLFGSENINLFVQN